MNKVLVVVDMQNDFIDGSLGTAEAVAIVPKVAARIREFDGPVAYTLDTHPENYLETREGKALPVVHCVRNTQGWELNPEVAAAIKEKRSAGIAKPTFGSMELPVLIRRLCPEPDEIELLGLCTDICVISNAMLCRAAFPEITIKVNSSCSAGVTPESHEQALKAMACCHIEII